MNKQYIKTLYEKYQYPYYDDFRKAINFHKTLIKKYYEYFGIWSRSVLDVGCGTGTKSIATHLLGNKVTAIDFSLRSIQTAQKMNKRFNADVDFICTDAESFVPDMKYDVIQFIGSLNHIVDYEAVLSKYVGYLNERGWIFFYVYNLWGWINNFNFFKIAYLNKVYGDNMEEKIKFCKKHFKKEEEHLLADRYCNNQHLFTVFGLTKTFKKLGMSKIEFYPKYLEPTLWGAARPCNW